MSFYIAVRIAEFVVAFNEWKLEGASSLVVFPDNAVECILQVVRGIPGDDLELGLVVKNCVDFLHAFFFVHNNEN